MTGATIQCLSHSANPAITLGAGRVNRTLVGEVQALCTSTVLDQQKRSGAGTQPRTAVGRLPCACSSRGAIPAELARRFERRSRTYEARALPTELHQHNAFKNSGGGGENCTPDDLLCRETPCCLGYTAS